MNDLMKHIHPGVGCERLASFVLAARHRTWVMIMERSGYVF
jgi:hypothetical protein